MLTHTSYSSWASFWQGHDRNRVHACPEKDHPTYDENRRMQVSSLTIPLQSRARALASK